MTHVPATHWHHHPDECHALIERKFRAFVLGFVFVTLVGMGIYAFFCLMCRTCWLRPILKAVQRRPKAD